MAGLQLGGLVSGMDTETIVAKLLAVDGQSKTRMSWNQNAAQTRQNALRDMETRLKSLKTATDDLGSSLLWTPTQSVDSSDATKVGARMSGGAAPGGYVVEVTQMATAAQQTFTWAPQASPSSIDIGGVSVTIDANADIDAAAAAINSNSQLGVYAINIGSGKLVLSSRQTGTDGAFTATGAGLTPESSKAAQNAKLSINGVAQPDQQSNVVSGVIPGVELTLKGISTATVNVSNPNVPRDTLVTKLKAFVSAYNDAVDFASDKLSEKKVANPANQSDAAKGVLFGDGGLRSVLTSMRSIVGNVVAGNPASSQLLSQIGLSTGAVVGSSATSADSIKGKLTLDESKLNSALDKDPLAVQRLLGGVSGVPGFSQSFKAMLDPLVTANGVFGQRVEAAGKEYTRIGADITRLGERLTNKEAALRKQFSAMESAMMRSQQAQADIAARLG
jgi:flagellar hook-associated protein 2